MQVDLDYTEVGSGYDDTDISAETSAYQHSDLNGDDFGEESGEFSALTSGRYRVFHLNFNFLISNFDTVNIILSL